MKPRFHNRYDPSTDHSPDNHTRKRMLRRELDRDETEEQVSLRQMVAMEHDWESGRRQALESCHENIT